MSASKTATISLPLETAEALRARVASGDYASESEVVREGLRALDAQEDRIEVWLRTEGVARDDAWRSAPDDVLTPGEVSDDLRRRAADLRSRNG